MLHADSLAQRGFIATELQVRGLARQVATLPEFDRMGALQRAVAAINPIAEDDVGSSHRLAPSPEEEAMAHQLFGRIDAEAEALPEIQRTALLMREIEGLDYGSISEKLAMPVNTVKSHIYRAREAVASGVRELLGPTRDRRW